MGRINLREIKRQEDEWNAEIWERMQQLVAEGMSEQDAFNQAWLDCGGQIIPLEITEKK